MIPKELAKRIPDAAALIARREKVLLDAAKSPGFGMAQLREAFSRMEDIH